MEIFNKVNLKQFTTLNYIVNNLEDDHSMTKINIELRNDKIDTPYYLDTKIAITHCTGMYNKGIRHAMDVLEHHRMYNLTENKYNELREITEKTFNKENKHLKIEKNDESILVFIETLTVEDLQSVLSEYNEFFEAIDKLA